MTPVERCGRSPQYGENEVITDDRIQAALRTGRVPSVRRSKAAAPRYPDLFDIALPAEDTESLVGAAYVPAADWKGFLAEQLTLVEQERQRIAADLHDGLGQSLCLLARTLRHLASAATGEGAAALQAQLAQMTRSVDEILADLRRTAMNLRPSMLDDLGLLPTLSWFLRDLESSCPGFQVVGRIHVTEGDIPEGMKTAVFRIIQEASTNALKHSRARKLEVSLRRRGSRLHLSISDDGRGFELPAALGVREADYGFGLRSMRARAEGSGGALTIKSAPGQGTRIGVEWRAAGVPLDGV